MKRILTFGEIMGRLCTDGFQRFQQALPGNVDLTFSGAEANVAASISMLGGESCFITALPDNEITSALINNLRGLGMDVSGIKKVDYGRLGLYFLEKGANQRPSRVVYDREYSAVSLTPGDAYDWDSLMNDAAWFHTTGITPALSEISAAAVLEAVKKAKEKGLTVSCDLNFRKKLWKWKDGIAPRELAGETMRKILPYLDVVIANEEDAHDILSISAEGSDVDGGKLNVEKYEDVAKEIIRQFPNVSKVAITLRESVSATHNNWGAMLYDGVLEKSYFAPVNENAYQPYEIRSIVDRVGGGDSFGAGLIYALNTPELSDTESAIKFAVAASCLCHSINGDFNYSSRSEVEALMRGSGSGRVVR